MVMLNQAEDKNMQSQIEGLRVLENGKIKSVDRHQELIMPHDDGELVICKHFLG